MLVALGVLAIADLVVGVSNDAVNFLNSAIGSKAISFKTIMIVASLGIAFGALSSSGMMEVARKGIFVPGEFYFNEIMIIFMAVMITDILFERRIKVTSLQEFYGDNLKLSTTNTRLGINNISIIRIIHSHTHDERLSRIVNITLI